MRRSTTTRRSTSPDFRRLIDAAGGVTITNELAIDDPSYDWFDGRHGFRLSAGRHALDGEDALAFVRSRSTPADDFNRARRQQEVLLALLEKITNPSMLPRIQQLIGVAGDTVRTNFPSDRLSDVLALAGGIDASTVSQVVLGPPYSVLVPGSQAAGMYSLHLDLHKVAALSIKVFGSEVGTRSPTWWYHRPWSMAGIVRTMILTSSQIDQRSM